MAMAAIWRRRQRRRPVGSPSELGTMTRAIVAAAAVLVVLPPTIPPVLPSPRRELPGTTMSGRPPASAPSSGRHFGALRMDSVRAAAAVVVMQPPTTAEEETVVAVDRHRRRLPRQPRPRVASAPVVEVEMMALGAVPPPPPPLAVVIPESEGGGSSLAVAAAVGAALEVATMPPTSPGRRPPRSLSCRGWVVLFVRCCCSVCMFTSYSVHELTLYFILSSFIL